MEQICRLEAPAQANAEFIHIVMPIGTRLLVAITDMYLVSDRIDIALSVNFVGRNSLARLSFTVDLGGNGASVGGCAKRIAGGAISRSLESEVHQVFD